MFRKLGEIRAAGGSQIASGYLEAHSALPAGINLGDSREMRCWWPDWCKHTFNGLGSCGSPGQHPASAVQCLSNITPSASTADMAIGVIQNGFDILLNSHPSDVLPRVAISDHAILLLTSSAQRFIKHSHHQRHVLQAGSPRSVSYTRYRRCSTFYATPVSHCERIHSFSDSGSEQRLVLRLGCPQGRHAGRQWLP